MAKSLYDIPAGQFQPQEDDNDHTAPSFAKTSAGDSIGSNIATTATLVVGTPETGYINSSTDTDWFAVELTAGISYEFTLNGTGGSALSDPKILLMNATGQQIELDDDGGSGTNSLLRFTADSSGTYYLAADNYSTQTGAYTIAANIVEAPTSSSNPLDAIDWGTTLSNGNASPTVIDVYFAGPSDGAITYATGQTTTSQGWSSNEINQAMHVFGVYEDILNVQFNQVNSSVGADFVMSLDSSIGGLGRFNPPGDTYAGVGIFNPNGSGWNAAGLEQGGYAYLTLLHEIGHGMGLAHPHDTGGSSVIMEDVASNAPYNDVGQFALNQSVYTAMSYIDGWQTGPDGPSTSTSYGWIGSIMALDIAALQQDYGANTTHNSGATSYNLATSNGAGTYYESIWDVSGVDNISYSGSGDARIDLREATIEYEYGGGGFMSYVEGIHGGFTIASGVVIENASGGSGEDVLLGNESNNNLEGNAGDDVIVSWGGNDTINGGAGIDVMLGGDGTDVILGGTNDDHIFGDNGYDYLYGEDGDDIFYAPSDGTGDYMNGGAGHDYFTAGSGIDTIDGGTGNDNISGGGSGDTLNGDAGIDFIYGQDGADIINGGDDQDYLYGGAGIDTVHGDGGNDFILSTGETETNYLYGDAGEDYVFGGNVADNIYGGIGNDFLFGADGNDIMRGGSENDYLFGQGGFNSLYGEDGNDVFISSDEIDGDLMYGGNGDDYFFGSAGTDEMYGDAGTDVIFSGGGDDFLEGGAGQDYLYSQGGSNTFSLTTGLDYEIVYNFTDNFDAIYVDIAGLDNYADMTPYIGYDASQNNTFLFGGDSTMVLIDFNVNLIDATDFTFAGAA